MTNLPRASLVLLALAVFLLVPAAGFAQTDPPAVTITGRVLDARSLSPVRRATVTVGEVRAETDDAGAFSLQAPRVPGITMQAAAAGYLTESRPLDIGAASATLTMEILLVSQSQVNEQISVVGRASDVATSPATTPLEPLQVRSVAGATENVFRVVQTLPGVAAADEFSSRLTVRGGSPDQNLTIMDGVEIHNPYRLFGLTSAFNPETIALFELTAGGFSPKYGDRLSSLMVVESRPGDASRRLGGSFTLGLTDTNVVLEGKLPGRSTGSWLVTGRRTYYDLIAGRVIDQSLPSFGDIQTNITWHPRPGQQISVVGLLSREHADAEFDDEDSGERFALRSGARNDMASVSFLSTLGGRATSRTIGAWYRNVDRVDVDGRFNNSARRSNSPGPPAVLNIAFARNILLRDVSLRQEITYTAGSRHTLEAGTDVHFLKTGWGWTIGGDRNESEANGSSIRGGAGLPEALNSSRQANRLGAWLVDRWEISRRLRVEPGARLDWTGINGERSVSPRLSASIDVGGGLRLRGVAGLYTQSPGYEKQLQSDYFVDLTAQDGVSLSNERSWHGIAGLEREFGDGVLARAEVYVKTFSGLIVGRLETASEVRARVQRYDFPASLTDSIPAAPGITSQPTNAASGHASGFDLYVARKAASNSARVSGWASYTFGRADRSAYGRTFPFDYDRRHTFSAVGSYRLSRLIELAVTARVASGAPSTPVAGLRVAAMESPAGTLVPERDAQGRLVYAVDLGGVENLNTDRLPTFARIDLRTTFRPGWMNRAWQLYLEVINVTNRRNVGRLEPRLEYDPSSDRPRLEYSREAGVPLLPTFGVRFGF